MAAENYAFIVCSIVGFVITLLPLPWHWNASNTGICFYRGWITASCLVGFIDAIVWNNNIVDWAPAWCAIVARFQAGSNVGSTSATLIIVRNLYGVVSSKAVNLSEKMKRRAMYIDLGIGFGLPVLQILMEYCLADEDYYIFEDIGCNVAIYSDYLAFVLIFCWPTILGIIAFIYGCLIIRMCAKAYAKLRAAFSDADTSHYFRLMALAVIQMLLIIPISVYDIAANAKTVYPVLGWEAIHAYFTEVTQIPASVWRSNRSLAAGTELSRWAVIFQAIISFVFFGYVREARIKYRHAFDYLIGRRQRIAPALIAGHVSTLPDFVTISQGSRPAASQPIVKQITFADSRHANVTVEPAQNRVDATEVPGTSDSLLTVPRPAYSPNAPSSNWAPGQLYEVRRDTIAP